MQAVREEPPVTSVKAPAKEPAKEPAKKPPRRRKWLRRLGITAACMPVFLVAMYFAVHHIPGFGPMVANGLRAVFGKTFVAWLEDTVYGAEDWVNMQRHADDPPEPMWQVPEE